MRYVIVFIVLVLSLNVYAQDEIYDNTFVRVYDLQGKKISKGTIRSITKSSIALFSKGEIINVPLQTIGKIKTKRSTGNAIAKGAMIGGGSLALLGLLSGDDEEGLISFSATDKAAIGLFSGSLFGAIVGAIVAIFKKSKTYIIDGNELQLQSFKEKMIA